MGYAAGRPENIAGEKLKTAIGEIAFAAATMGETLKMALGFQTQPAAPVMVAAATAAILKPPTR